MSDTTAIEVTQADRDAAADYQRIICDRRWGIEGILNGGCDNTSVVQAFAAHRVASESALRERVAALEGALHTADEALCEYACYEGNFPCARTPDQCLSRCGKEAGDALTIIRAALAAIKAPDQPATGALRMHPDLADGERN